MRRHVKKSSVIIAIIVAFLVMAIVIVINLVHSGIRFSSISTLHGEDYKDGRQKSWELVDGDDNPVLTISVDRRYILSGQNDFSCEMAIKNLNASQDEVDFQYDLIEKEVIAQGSFEIHTTAEELMLYMISVKERYFEEDGE